MVAGVRSGAGVWKQEMRRRPPQVPGREMFLRVTNPDRVRSCVAASTVRLEVEALPFFVLTLGTQPGRCHVYCQTRGIPTNFIRRKIIHKLSTIQLQAPFPSADCRTRLEVGVYIRNTPNVPVELEGACECRFPAAIARPKPTRSRVSCGRMIPSSHSRADAYFALDCCSIFSANVAC